MCIYAPSLEASESATTRDSCSKTTEKPTWHIFGRSAFHSERARARVIPGGGAALRVPSGAVTKAAVLRTAARRAALAFGRAFGAGSLWWTWNRGSDWPERQQFCPHKPFVSSSLSAGSVMSVPWFGGVGGYPRRSTLGPRRPVAVLLLPLLGEDGRRGSQKLAPGSRGQ